MKTLASEVRYVGLDKDRRVIGGHKTFLDACRFYQSGQCVAYVRPALAAKRIDEDNDSPDVRCGAVVYRSISECKYIEDDLNGPNCENPVWQLRVHMGYGDAFSLTTDALLVKETAKRLFSDKNLLRVIGFDEQGLTLTFDRLTETDLLKMLDYAEAIGLLGKSIAQHSQELADVF